MVAWTTNKLNSPMGNCTCVIETFKRVVTRNRREARATTRFDEFELLRKTWCFAVSHSCLFCFSCIAGLSSFPPARQGYSGTALFVRKRRGWDM